MTRDVLLLAANLALAFWEAPTFVLLYVPPARTRGPWRRWLRIACPFLLPAWAVLTVLDPPTWWWPWLGTIACPFVWRWMHRRFCKDKHGRRLMEAARGWVRRQGNRLVVTPEVAR